jgi:hypothetical protein
MNPFDNVAKILALPMRARKSDENDDWAVRGVEDNL